MEQAVRKHPRVLVECVRADVIAEFLLHHGHDVLALHESGQVRGKRTARVQVAMLCAVGGLDSVVGGGHSALGVQ
jgi:hypothetical protein